MIAGGTSTSRGSRNTAVASSCDHSALSPAPHQSTSYTCICFRRNVHLFCNIQKSSNKEFAISEENLSLFLWQLLLIFMVLQCKNQDWWRHLLRHSNSFFDHFSPVEISYLTVWKTISVIIQSSYINGLSTTKTLTKCTMTRQETMRTEISSSEKII